MRNPHGNLVITSPDGTVENDTARCVHCGGHFNVGKASVKWCGSCHDTVCEKAACSAPCERGALHFMREIEKQEARGRLLRAMGI